MIRLMVAAAICIFLGGFASKAIAEPVTEAAVDKACGNQIESGCIGSKCASGCKIKEGGKLIDYGCTYPNKTGKTKAVCNRTPMSRKIQSTTKSDAGKTVPALKTD